MGRMLLDVGFVYTAIVVPPRCRKAIAVKVLGIMTVAIRTLEIEDTDVAFMYRTRNPFEDRKPWQSEANEVTRWSELHWDGETLFRNSGPRGVERGEAEIRHSFLTMSPHSPMWYTQTGGRRAETAAVPRSDVVGKILSDDMKIRMEAIREKSTRIALRDKSWVITTGEPVWETIQQDKVTPARVQVSLLNTGNDADSLHDLSRADRRKESLLWLPEEDQDPECVGGQIEVVIPWAVKAPVSTIMLARVVSEAVHEKQQVGAGWTLQHLPKEYILAWGRVRDVLPEIEAAPKGFMSPGTASLVGELVTAAHQFNEIDSRLKVAWKGWLLDNPSPGPTEPIPARSAP